MPNFEIDFNKQFKDGANSAQYLKVDGKFDRVIFCGMGGSAIPGEIISMLWIDGFMCYLNREFGLPSWVDKKCLVICTSWSGDIEETISSFDEAIKRGLTTVAVSKGGELAQRAKNANALFIGLKEDKIPARFGVGYMVGAILTLLGNSAIIDGNLSMAISTLTEKAVDADFSSRIINKLPLIYSSYPWRYLARFWKIYFNESSKIHSFSSYFPEAAHNEIVGFTPMKKDSYFPIILIDKDEEKDDIQKLEKFDNFLKKQDVDYETIYLEGRDRFEKILHNYNYAISVSTALAKAKGIEPFDATVIEQFKKA